MSRLRPQSVALALARKAIDATGSESPAEAAAGIEAAFGGLLDLMSPIVGDVGFRTLAERAQRKAHCPWEIALDEGGRLVFVGLTEAAVRDGAAATRTSAATLLGELIALLFDFIGEKLTLQLLLSWPSGTLDGPRSGGQILLDRERFLKRVGTVFEETRHHQAALQRVAVLAVPELADAVVFELATDSTHEKMTFAAGTVPGAAAQADLYAEMVRTGATAVASGPLGSGLCAPIHEQGKLIGSLFAWFHRTLQPGEVAIFEQLADRAGIAVDNARLLEETKTAVRVRDEMLAAISHDFASPLAAVRFSAQALLHDAATGRLPPDLVTAADTIRQAEEQLQAMVAELVDVASVHMGRMVLRRADHDLAAIVDQVFRMLEGQAGARSVRLLRTGAAPTVSCDRPRALRLLANLVGNAVKFTREGSAVTVAIERGPKETIVSVTDRGPGIAPAERERLFQPYSSGEAGRNSGTGLGLYIAQGIARAHGGRVWLERSSDRGSTFAVALPAMPGR